MKASWRKPGGDSESQINADLTDFAERLPNGSLRGLFTGMKGIKGIFLKH